MHLRALRLSDAKSKNWPLGWSLPDLTDKESPSESSFGGEEEPGSPMVSMAWPPMGAGAQRWLHRFRPRMLKGASFRKGVLLRF
jgi:hypothetical protein